jgi:hypothetical protein
VTFKVGDIVQWNDHPRDKTLIGTLAEIYDVYPPGDAWAFAMTGSLTEAAYDVIDVRGGERGARHSWLRLPPPVAITVREESHEA